jgi:hypothetical protein
VNNVFEVRPSLTDTMTLFARHACLSVSQTSTTRAIRLPGRWNSRLTFPGQSCLYRSNHHRISFGGLIYENLAEAPFFHPLSLSRSVSPNGQLERSCRPSERLPYVPRSLCQSISPFTLTNQLFMSSWAMPLLVSTCVYSAS